MEKPREDGLGVGWDRVDRPNGQDREVDLQPVAKEHAPLLEAADRRRLDQGQQRLAERAQPRPVAEVPPRIVHEEGQVDVRELVRRRVPPRLRADQ
jgi:hypothetical protein